MRRLALAIAALALLCTPAAAQTYARGQTGAIGTVITATTPDGASVKAVLPAVTGSVASGATDSGSPVKVGCVFNSTLPTVTTGQRVDCQASARGETLVAISSGSVAANVATVTADGLSGLAGLYINNRPQVFNGSTWDRQFTCGSSAVVNVTAGATTQVVGLSGSTVIRACAVSITMSAAGTAKIVSGTGTNCGTGTADVTGAFTLATGTPLTMSVGAGSVLRGPAGAALCVVAVTGNVTGVITYAQF